MTYKVLSLWQPWATLWASGIKRNETRSWPTRHRGPLLIHAAQHWGPEQRDICRTNLVSQLVFELGHDPDDDRGCWGLPRGAIVGRVEVGGCDPTSGCVAGALEMMLGDYRPGRYAWLGDEHRLFEWPIPCPGQRNIFEMELADGVIEAAGMVVLRVMRAEVAEAKSRKRQVRRGILRK